MTTTDIRIRLNGNEEIDAQHHPANADRFADLGVTIPETVTASIDGGRGRLTLSGEPDVVLAALAAATDAVTAAIAAACITEEA